MPSNKERDELHKAIWSIADDSRGSVDGWDFKQYILGIMFYRYISENITNYINEGERKAGDKNFDYATLSDEVAESERQNLVKEKGFFILPSELFCNVCKKAKDDENLNETLEKIFNNIISDLKNQKITAIDKKNNIVTINPKILNELNNKNSEYYKYLYKEIEEKFREAKQNNNTIINLNLPFSTRKLEEKNTVNLENEILKDQEKKNFLRGVY